MTDQQIPQALIELHESGKPRELAAGYLKHFQGQLQQALNYDQVSNPRGGPLSMESFAAAVELEVSTNERLVEAMYANPASFMKAIMLAAQCKLLPGSAFNRFYLIPRWNGREKRLEVTPLIGYRGLSDMAQRHPRVHKVDAVLVFEGEEFEYDSGAGKLRHIVDLSGERTEDKIIGGYARVVITEPASTHPVLDDPVILVKGRDELMAIKARSDAYQRAENSGKRNSPWHTDPLPMHRKTLIRAVLNGGSVPCDMGVGAAISADDAAQMPTTKVEVGDAPKSRAESIRGALGIEESSDPLFPFDLVEEATAALDACESVAEMESLRDRFQHFQGEDATTLSRAWERNEERLKDA